MALRLLHHHPESRRQQEMHRRQFNDLPVLRPALLEHRRRPGLDSGRLHQSQTQASLRIRSDRRHRCLREAAQPAPQLLVRHRLRVHQRRLSRTMLAPHSLQQADSMYHHLSRANAFLQDRLLHLHARAVLRRPLQGNLQEIRRTKYRMLQL